MSTNSVVIRFCLYIVLKSTVVIYMISSFQTETLDDIFGRLSPVTSMPEDAELDLIGS